jgi:hypothetical protein
LDFGAAVIGRRVREWFLGPVAVHPMVVNRIVFGGVLLLHALSRIPEFGRLYASDSVAWSIAYREFVATFVAADLAAPALWTVSILAQMDPAFRQLAVVSFYGLLILASLAFIVGWKTRISGVTAIAMHLLFLAIHPFAHYGWASMMAPFTLYVVLSRAGEYGSIDARIERARDPSRRPPLEVPAWPMRLLQVHVAAMYFHTGFARIDDPDWLRGEVLFEALTRTLFSRFTLDLEMFLPAMLALSYVVFLLEPLAALLLWIPRLRTLCALALIAMHVCLEVLTNVGWWNYIMIGGLVTFLPPHWLERWLPLRR